MKVFSKFLSIKSILSGVTLTILGAIFFIGMEEKTLSYVLLAGGFFHYLIATIMFFRGKTNVSQ